MIRCCVSAQFPCIVCLMKALSLVCRCTWGIPYVIMHLYYVHSGSYIYVLLLLLWTVACIWIVSFLGRQTCLNSCCTFLDSASFNPFHILSSVATMYTFNSLHHPSLQLQSTQWHPHHTCIHTNRFTIHFGPVSMEFVQPRGPWLQYVLVRSWRFVPHQAGHDPEKTRDRHPTISIKGHSSFCW